MTTPYILAIDQGTSSSRAIVFDANSNIISQSQMPFQQHYPQDGWVEHSPDEIWQTTLQVSREALQTAEQQGGQVVAIGITNQRETTVLWERDTLKPIYNAIVWQDRRTASICDNLRQQISEQDLQAKTGLLLDPYFSATKIAWILDHVDSARNKTDQLAFGTIDSFLVTHLTKGKVHATDATNAGRTNIFNIQTQEWDSDLLKLFNVPKEILPEVKDCMADFGMADKEWFGREIPILGIAGDQHAALIGQAGFNQGDIKSTYGTGCFILSNTGNDCLFSQNKLLTTVGYRLNGEVTYALEGSIFNAGTTIQWLRDNAEFFSDASETEAIAEQLDSTQGVYFVPAFTGMGAPYWNADARGLICGITRDTQKQHIVRAGLESVCYQTYDLLNAMQKDGLQTASLKIDGGMVGNNWLAQFLADILQVNVQRPQVMETTALGAAYLAGLKAGVYDSLEAIENTWQCEQEFTPQMQTEQRELLLTGWQKAVKQTLSS